MKKRRPTIIRVFPDESTLWEYITPNLRGKWWRLEAVTPNGLTDCFGLWRGKTWWCELKVGRPSLDALRPDQRQFGYDCIDHGIEHWTCFGYKGDARFFKDLDFGTEQVPPYYRAT